MASIPLPALAVNPPQQPDLLGQMGKLSALRSGQQQQQIQGLEIQQQQQALKDSQAMTAAMQQWDGKDLEELPSLVIKNKGSAKAVLGLKTSILQQKKTYSEMAKDDAETGQKNMQMLGEKHDMLAGAIRNVLSLPDEQLAAGVQQTLKQSLQNGLIKPEEAQQFAPISQLPPDKLRSSLQFMEKHFMGDKAQREAAQQEANQAREKAAAAETARHNQAMEEQPTEVRLAERAAGGDAAAEAALKRLDASKRASRPVMNLMTNTDVKDIADAIENGDQPPTLQGLYRNAAPVRGELARRGVPIAKMELDWNATKKYMGTINGTQQTRLRQAITTAADSLDKIEGLYADVQRLAPVSGFRMLNKAALTAMKNLPGEAGAKAQALDAQIADLTSELGNVYMGGNSPTDHALSLAQKNLSSEWNSQTFAEALKQARLNLKIRQNSILHAAPVGLSGESNYFPNPQTPTAAKTIRARDPQGKLHEAPEGTPLPQGWKLE